MGDQMSTINHNAMHARYHTSARYYVLMVMKSQYSWAIDKPDPEDLKWDLDVLIVCLQKGDQHDEFIAENAQKLREVEADQNRVASYGFTGTYQSDSTHGRDQNHGYRP